MCTVIGVKGRRLPLEELESAFMATISRGPDSMEMQELPGAVIGFQRLSIMDLTESGMQPFCLKRSPCGAEPPDAEVPAADTPERADYLVCNGEIYGFRGLKAELAAKGYCFTSNSDCEVILPLYREYGLEMFPLLGSEFALLLYDGEKDDLIAARDPIGIRPLYYGEDRFGELVFASEPKDLLPLCEVIKPFPPGCYYAGGAFYCYMDIATSPDPGDPAVKPAPAMTGKPGLDKVCRGIRDLLIASVKARLDADAPVGFLLSGGLDSSLVCGISARLTDRPLRTFAIGMDTDPIDLKYARQAADYIGSEHTEFRMTKEEVLAAVPEVIKILGTWDITTIRASIGMYLCCRKIRESTDIRVLMTGEISDELFGYKYTDFAPDAASFQREAEKRIREIHMYDVLRADRCISVNSMEGRVPFGDTELVRYVMAIDPELKMNRFGMGKYLLRRAFAEEKLVPDEILWREKAAFSDAVGHSMVDDLKEHAEQLYSDEEFRKASAQYGYCRPFTKESLWYRELFESFYPGQAGMICDYWMPNREWAGCAVDDPSARVLANYGKSGK
ncbi:MAG: asparagine synthase B [Clostridia bacterium]|nr:asparagine synthase B [Clostridia bacterium]